MRLLLVTSAVAVVVVAGIAIYANALVGRVEKKRAELDGIAAERLEELRALDLRFPPPPEGRLDAKRFVAWLEVRTAVGLAWEARAAEAAEETVFHALETRNELLERLRKELEARSMGLAEYRATARRFHALLGLPEFEELRRHWASKVWTGEHPKGLPLPAPAADADPAERALVQSHAAALRDSAAADLLLPLLE